MNLFEISEEHRQLLDAIDEAEGVLTPELEERLVINQQNLTKKAEDYSASIMQAKSAIAVLYNEKKRIEKMINSERRKMEILSNNLSCALQTFNIHRYDVGKYRISFRKSTQLEINDEESIPEIYKVNTVTYNKEEMKMAIKEGQEVPGVSLVTKQNLQIR